jgi:tetratricopeptide (TPR) repeat protein
MSSRRVRTKGDEDRKGKRSPSDLYDAALRHFQSDRLGPAEDRCQRALALNPEHADCLHLLGMVHAKTNKLDSAVDLIAAAIRCNPNCSRYFSDLGSLLHAQNRFEEARKSLDLAIKLAPGSAVAWINLGDLLRAQGLHDEALLTYDHASTLDSTDTDPANKAGTLLLELNRCEEALARFDRAQAISADQVDVLRYRGECLGRLKRRDEAIAQFRRAIQLKPDFVIALNKLGLLLRESKRFDEALSIFDRALSFEPDQAELYCNKGVVLMALGRYEEALALFDRAISFKPDFAHAYNNRGSCLDELLRVDEALESFNKAIKLEPDYPNPHWNLACNRLRVGEFKTGWAKAEWRCKVPGLTIQDRSFDRPLWLGAEPIAGKTVLLHSDQGLGDALQFCRYVPLVAAMGARVTLGIQEPLRELVSQLGGVSRVVTAQGASDFDFHCPLSSLPLVFDTTLDTIPSATPYISAGSRAETWKVRLASVNSPRVGLVWSGNPDHANDRNRSMPLGLLLPLLDVGARFVSLQKNARAVDQAILDQRNEILDLGPELESFADTAAVISHLDLVISVDTSVAHLAGALGRPVWILLPYVPDWRWLLHRTDSPWYPTARLFRQSETRDWQTVVAQVGSELRSFIPSLQSSV